jgi:nicotinamidase-related amidase
MAALVATLRDAHVRGFNLILLDDGCAAFTDDLHRATIASLGSVAEVMPCVQFQALIESK